MQAPPAKATPVPEGMAAPEERLGDQAATEIPVRELPRRRLELDRPNDGPYDVHDFFDLVPAADSDATVDGLQRIDTRPRVRRVYGYCLPIALGMLLALVATVTLLANLLLGPL